jgi:CRISPR/Cas system endoribonuclease Cas6 (RAMP superfamily)
VLRVSHLEGATLPQFHIGLNVFQVDAETAETIREALQETVHQNFRADLTGMEGDKILRFPLAASTVVSPRLVRVTFRTPTELKNHATPKFGPLFARIRDRISTLRALYGPGPLEIDFKAMGERAAAIRMTRCDLMNGSAERVGKRHELGGFTGVAEYEGHLAEFLPYLEIARYTGVGRQTVWGKGEISVETF